MPPQSSGLFGRNLQGMNGIEKNKNKVMAASDNEPDYESDFESDPEEDIEPEEVEPIENPINNEQEQEPEEVVEEEPEEVEGQDDWMLMGEDFEDGFGNGFEDEEEPDEIEEESEAESCIDEETVEDTFGSSLVPRPLIQQIGFSPDLHHFGIGSEVYLRVYPLRTYPFKSCHHAGTFLGPVEIVRPYGDIGFKVAGLPRGFRDRFGDVCQRWNLFSVAPDRGRIVRQNMVDFDDDRIYEERPWFVGPERTVVGGIMNIVLISVEWVCYGVYENAWSVEREMCRDFPHLFTN